MKTGFVGWRGMVGSVLLQRMHEENDFENIDAVFFTTSQVGKPSPLNSINFPTLIDAFDIEELKQLYILRFNYLCDHPILCENSIDQTL